MVEMVLEYVVLSGQLLRSQRRNSRLLRNQTQRPVWPSWAGSCIQRAPGARREARSWDHIIIIMYVFLGFLRWMNGCRHMQTYVFCAESRLTAGVFISFQLANLWNTLRWLSLFAYRKTPGKMPKRDLLFKNGWDARFDVLVAFGGYTVYYIYVYEYA